MKIVRLSSELIAVLLIGACTSSTTFIEQKKQPPLVITNPEVEILPTPSLSEQSKPPLVEWINFVRAVDALDKEALVQKKHYLQQEEMPVNADTYRMQLAYVTLRLANTITTLEKSEALLDEIEQSHQFFPFYHSLRREINLRIEQIIAQQKQKQLEKTLKNTQYSLNKKKKEANALRKQLDLLKAVDGDLNKIQKEINKVSP